MRYLHSPFVCLSFALVLSGCLVATQPKNDSIGTNPNITVDTPAPYSVVKSPLTITGSARGMWYFEASFPVLLLDGNEKEIAITPAEAQGDWMTESFVPYQALLEFTQPSTKTGTLLLQKDNPSGLPEHDAEIRIPVSFQ